MMSAQGFEDNIQNKSEDISLKELILKIKDWFFYILSKWMVILACVFIGAILGYFYASSKKPVYTAVTTFVLEESNSSASSLGNLGGLASMVGIDVGGGGGIFQGDNILELYKSRTMIENTLLTEVQHNGKKQLLIDVYLDFSGIRKNWVKSPDLKYIRFSDTEGRPLKSFSRLQDSIIGDICNVINVNYLKVAKPDKKLSIIRAEVKSANEFFAKSFNDQIVKNVNDFYIQTKTKKSLENVLILKQKVDSVRSVMNGAIYTAAIVSDETPNLNPTRQVQRLAPIQRSQFSAETNKAILSELVKNLEMSKMSLLKEAPLIQVVDRPIFPLEKENFGKLKGIILGGFIAGFLICFVLIFRRVIKNILS